jgi:hypothetical protein
METQGKECAHKYTKQRNTRCKCFVRFTGVREGGSCKGCVPGNIWESSYNYDDKW